MTESNDMTHREIPDLPQRPRVHPIAGGVSRSYPVGRQSYSRSCQGKIFTLTITTGYALPDGAQACLATTLNSSEDNVWTKVPFVRSDMRTLQCSVVPRRPGVHSFRAEFSLDGGKTWVRDTVSDAWALIDPPQVDALRVYNLIPAISGMVADWKQDLRRIGAMGFNAVYLLPVTPMDTSESPYSAKDLFGVDPGYLTEGSNEDALAQLGEFVEEARALGIRLVFDLVLNHVGVNSTIAQRAPDWITPDQDRPDGLKRAGYWSDQGWRTWEDLALINYEHPSEAIRSEIWAYMIDYALFWAKYANDTEGFVRFDNLHSSDRDFVQAVTAAIHSNYPAVGLLAEFFTDERTLLETGPKWGLNLILATPWNYKFVPQLREYLNYIHRVSQHIRYFMPITSQDSGAPAQEFGSADSTIPRYVAAALLGTGATGMPQGVEYGEQERINFIGRKPKAVFPSEPAYARVIGRVNAILADHPAFRRGGNFTLVDRGHAAIIAAFRHDPGPEAFGFLVVCNFDIHASQRITIDLRPLIGTDGPFSCSELLSETAPVVLPAESEFLLPACSAQVLEFHRKS